MTVLPSFTCPRCGRTSFSERDADEGYCGACHDWTGRPGLRFRVYVAGDLVSDYWTFPDSDPVSAASRQADICRRAESADLPWLLEVYDPDRPDRAVRLGSHAVGMIDPLPVDLADVDGVIGQIAKGLGLEP